MAESEKILQVVAQAGIGEIAARVPGGSTALAVVQAVFRNCTDKRAQELFAAIGERIGAEDWDAAAKKLEKNIGQSWFDETIERGFRDIIECVSSEARRCIGFLVSEYLGRQTKPDPTFRKVAWLLRESNETALRTFSDICGMYAELTDGAQSGLRVLVRASRRSREPGLFWLAVHRDESSVLGRRVTEPENLVSRLGIK